MLSSSFPVFLLLGWPSVTRPTRGREGRGRGSRGRREGVGGTWRTKGAIESDGGDTVVGGEVKGGLTPSGPDGDKLCQRGHQELGISSS